MMDEKAKEARRLYIRAWQRANKDKVRAAQIRYWKKKAAEMEPAASESEDTSDEH